MVNDSCFISFVISQYRVHENTLFWQVDVWAIWNSGVRILPLLTNSHTFSTLSFTGIKVYSALYERTRRKRQPKSIKKASGMIHVTIVSKWKYYYNLRFIIVNGRFFFILIPINRLKYTFPSVPCICENHIVVWIKRQASK